MKTIPQIVKCKECKGSARAEVPQIYGLCTWIGDAFCTRCNKTVTAAFGTHYTPRTTRMVRPEIVAQYPGTRHMEVAREQGKPWDSNEQLGTSF